MKTTKATSKKSSKVTAKAKTNPAQGHIVRQFAAFRAHTNPTFQKNRTAQERKQATANLAAFVKKHPFLRPRLAVAA